MILYAFGGKSAAKVCAREIQREHLLESGRMVADVRTIL